MSAQEGLSIFDALDNLNTLVDATSLEEIEVTADARFISHKEEEVGEEYWLKAAPDEQTIDAIRKTFRVVYTYLQTYNQKMKGNDPKHLTEGINAIMILVGEATKNLGRFSVLFKERITDSHEYQHLQDFYKNKIIKTSFQKFKKMPTKDKKKVELSSWQEEVEGTVAKGKAIREVADIHILNDVNVIKRDHLYELFYMKNGTGHSFYTHELARNIKLVCDFGEFSEQYFGEDPLLQIKNWEDKSLHLLAQNILKVCRLQIEKFYSKQRKYKDIDFVKSIHYALMSLNLAANPRNLIRQFSFKGCYLYFADFLQFLRKALSSQDYQKMAIYPSSEGEEFFIQVIELMDRLCFSLFTLKANTEELSRGIEQLIVRGNGSKGKKLSERLLSAYRGLSTTLQHHPNGPVFKAVDIMNDEKAQVFDPLASGIFGVEWAIKRKGEEIFALRIPCPTIQDQVNQAYVAREFQTFLESLHEEEKFLFVDYQNRTSWLEEARSVAIEELGKRGEFAKHLTVITLSKNSDFYHQRGDYEQLTNAHDFMTAFSQMLHDEKGEYYFPQAIKKELFPSFISSLLKKIHVTFFDTKKTLTVVERTHFIDLAYHFITLKCCEIIKPTYFTLTSKDGLDLGGTSSVGLIALLTVDKKKKWKEKEGERLNTILFGPTLMVRERSIQPESFDRVHSLIHLLEGKGEYLHAFKELYKKETLIWDVHL